MSTISSNLLMHFGNLKCKQFVRESVAQHQDPIIYHDQLNFNGEEAKEAYEEVISQDNGTSQSQVDKRTKRPSNFQCHKAKQSNGSVDVKININMIFKAVETRDLNFLKAHLNRKNVNVVDNYGWTPLMSAAFCGHDLIVKLLLELGANKNCRDKAGLTALKLAQKNHHFNIVDILQSRRTVKEKNQPFHPANSEKEEFYCSICERTFRETTVREHEASTLHLFNTKPKLPDPAYGIPKQNKGYQMMLNDGWEEKNGLGPSGSGQKYPVKTVLKRDRKGLGQLPKPEARVTHFQSGDVKAIAHIRQFPVGEHKMPWRKKDLEKRLSNERWKERALRRALS